MKQPIKIQHSGLPSGVKTEQPMMAQKYKHKTITIERPQTKWDHMNKTWIHNFTSPYKHSQASPITLSPAN